MFSTESFTATEVAARVRNAGAETAISLHIYGTDISRLGSSVRRVYDLPVVAGMPGFGDTKAWIFLDNIYAVAGSKNYFDAAALHPYARDINEFRSEITLFRASMTNHDDAATASTVTAPFSGPRSRIAAATSPRVVESRRAAAASNATGTVRSTMTRCAAAEPTTASCRRARLRSPR